MDRINIKKGDYGFALTFINSLSWEDGAVYFIVWKRNDPNNPILSAICEPHNGNYRYIIQAGDFQTVGKYNYELARVVADEKEESTNTGEIIVVESPVITPEE